MFSLLLRRSMLSVSPRSEPLPEERSSRSRGSNRSSPTIKHNHKFIATKTSEKIAFSHSALESFCNLTQQLITTSVTKTVIHDLEVVEIDEQQPDKSRTRTRKSLLKNLLKVRPVCKSGEFVMTGGVGELLSIATLFSDIFDVMKGEQNPIVF